MASNEETISKLLRSGKSYGDFSDEHNPGSPDFSEHPKSQFFGREKPVFVPMSEFPNDDVDGQSNIPKGEDHTYSSRGLGNSGSADFDNFDMSLFAKFQQFGISLGLSGPSLADFVCNQVRQEKESHLNQARLDKELYLKEQLWHKQGSDNGSQSKNVVHDNYKLVIKPLGENEDIDFFLLNFERIAELHRWNEDMMTVRLPPLLTGKAQRAYLRMTPDEVRSYDIIKQNILEEYKKTPECYRKQFREIRKESDETFRQFARRQKLMFDRWFQVAKCDETFEALVELILQEQFMETLSPDLCMYVKQRKPKSVSEAAELAFDYVEIKREVHFKNKKSTGNEKNHNQSDVELKDEDRKDHNKNQSSDNRFAKVKCHKCNKFGHIQKYCTSVGRIRVESNTQNDLLKDLTPLCEKCEKIPFCRDTKVLVNGKECHAIRDTGADDICIKPEFVNDEDYLDTTEHVSLAVLGICGEFQRAKISIDSPFICGQVQCVVIPDLGPDIFIGE